MEEIVNRNPKDISLNTKFANIENEENILDRSRRDSINLSFQGSFDNSGNKNKI